MKKILVIAVALFLAWPAFSQSGVRFGIKAGGNLTFSKVEVQNVSLKGDSRFGFYAGGLMEISPVYPENRFKIQVEALYNRANVQFSTGTVDEQKGQLNINQIVVPVLAKYFIIPELSVNLGPTFNYNLGGTQSAIDTSGVKVSTDIGKDDLNAFQIGLAAGLTYYVCDGLFIDARYTPLFGSFNKKADDDLGVKYRLSGIQLGIGYKF